MLKGPRGEEFATALRREDRLDDVDLLPGQLAIDIREVCLLGVVDRAGVAGLADVLDPPAQLLAPGGLPGSRLEALYRLAVRASAHDVLAQPCQPTPRGLLAAGDQAGELLSGEGRDRGGHQLSGARAAR